MWFSLAVKSDVFKAVKNQNCNEAAPDFNFLRSLIKLYSDSENSFKVCFGLNSLNTLLLDRSDQVSRHCTHNPGHKC